MLVLTRIGDIVEDMKQVQYKLTRLISSGIGDNLKGKRLSSGGDSLFHKCYFRLLLNA
jgi:hypothetical protein